VRGDAVPRERKAHQIDKSLMLEATRHRGQSSGVRSAWPRSAL